MRIRTDGEFEHRKSTIESCAKHYDCNKTKAMLLAADQVPQLHGAVREILERDDLTQRQKLEIAQTFNKARGIEITIETSVTVETK